MEDRRVSSRSSAEGIDALHATNPCDMSGDHFGLMNATEPTISRGYDEVSDIADHEEPTAASAEVTSPAESSDLSLEIPLWFQNIRMERSMPIDEIERSSRLVIDLVESRYSLAKATDYVYTHSGTDKPENAAMYNMTPTEVEQYVLFQKHGAPVKLNKEQDQLVSPKGGRQFPRMIEALDRMFETKGHTKDNVAYFYHHFPDHVPLLKALYKVSNAERNARSNTNIGIEAFQEYQTCRKVLGNAQYVYQHTSPEGRLVAQSVRRLQTILERHMAECAGDKLRSRKPPPQPSDGRRFRTRPKRPTGYRQFSDAEAMPRSYLFQNSRPAPDLSESMPTKLHDLPTHSVQHEARDAYPSPWESRSNSSDSQSASSSGSLLSSGFRYGERNTLVSDVQLQYPSREYRGFVRSPLATHATGEPMDISKGGPIEAVVPKKCSQSRFFPSGNGSV